MAQHLLAACKQNTPAPSLYILGALYGVLLIMRLYRSSAHWIN